MAATQSSTDVLNQSECWNLLRQGVIGRLAVVSHGEPDIFPVNYVVDHGSIVFRTATGSKHHSSAGRPVAFEVDGYNADDADDADSTAWSVVVRGVVHEIRETDEVIAALALPLRPWHDGLKPRFMRVEASAVTGRRLHVAGDISVPSSPEGPTTPAA